MPSGAGNPSVRRPSQVKLPSGVPRQVSVRTASPLSALTTPVHCASSKVSWKIVTVSLLPSPSGENTASDALTVAAGAVRSISNSGASALGRLPFV